MINKVLFSSESVHWATPKELYDKLDEEFHFNYDPCPLNCSEDRLNMEWGTRNFVNPPYKDVAKFVTKGFDEAKKGKLVVFLIPSRTDTRWFHRYFIPFCCPTDVNKEVVWAAGIVDGEGCIRIDKKSVTEKNNLVNPSYRLSLGVKMTSLETVQQLKSIFRCGNIYPERYDSKKTCYRWEVGGKDAYIVLRRMYPFSVTKEKEIFLGIDYFAEPKKLTGWKPTNPNVIERDEEYYQLLRKCKKETIDIVPVHVDIRFIKGRLKFGDAVNSAPFPSCIAIFGASYEAQKPTLES